MQTLKLVVVNPLKFNYNIFDSCNRLLLERTRLSLITEIVKKEMSTLIYSGSLHIVLNLVVSKHTSVWVEKL